MTWITIRRGNKAGKLVWASGIQPAASSHRNVSQNAPAGQYQRLGQGRIIDRNLYAFNNEPPPYQGGGHNGYGNPNQ